MLLVHPATEAGKLSPVEVARTLSAIPSAPSVLSKLCLLLRDGSPSLGELARLVRLDPGLCCRVMRAAYEFNDDSPFRATIEDAINCVGAQRVTEIARRVVRSQLLDFPLEVYGMDTDDFWRRSVATAIGAELLAEHTGEEADVAYLLGLLHNAGMFAVENWIRQESPGLVFAHRAWPREYSAAESAILGFTHAEVAAGVLTGWNFPSAVTEPIRYQFVPTRFGPHARLTCLVHIAKWLAAAVCTEGGVPTLPDARYLDVLRLTSYELMKLVVEVRVRIGHARQTVEIRAA